MKNRYLPTAISGGIKLAAIIAASGFAASTANAAVVIPMTGANVIPELLINSQTTTAIGSGVGAIAVVPAGSYTQAYFTFSSVFSEASATINIGSYSSQWVRDGNTFTTTSQAQVDGLLNALSTTGPSSISLTGSGELPNGNTLQTLTFVPEPSTTLLGALGIFGLLRRKR